MDKVLLATILGAALASAFFIGAARADAFLYADINNFDSSPTSSSFGTIDLNTGAFQQSGPGLAMDLDSQSDDPMFEHGDISPRPSAALARSQ